MNIFGQKIMIPVWLETLLAALALAVFGGVLDALRQVMDNRDGITWGTILVGVGFGAVGGAVSGYTSWRRSVHAGAVPGVTDAQVNNVQNTLLGVLTDVLTLIPAQHAATTAKLDGLINFLGTAFAQATPAVVVNTGSGETTNVPAQPAPDPAPSVPDVPPAPTPEPDPILDPAPAVPDVAPSTPDPVPPIGIREMDPTIANMDSFIATGPDGTQYAVSKL